MEDKHDIAYKTILHKKFDYTVDDKIIDNKEEEEKLILKCSKCGTEIQENDNFCKKCGKSTQESSTTNEEKNLQDTTKNFIIFIVILAIVGFICLSPIEFDIEFLGLTVHPKLRYSVLEQALNIEIGAISFKKENVSIVDYISLKYKYFTNKKEIDDVLKNLSKNIWY